MDVHTSGDRDDLNDVERRLKGWPPSTDGLDADAMLFAAGLAAGRPGRNRFLAPALCGLLAALALGLGAWGLTERAERLALASRFVDHGPASNRSAVAAGAVLSEPSSANSPESYLNLRRIMEQDPSSWLASLEPTGPQRMGPAPPQPAIFRAGQRDALRIQ
jgi:hypothetical protein